MDDEPHSETVQGGLCISTTGLGVDVLRPGLGGRWDGGSRWLRLLSADRAFSAWGTAPGCVSPRSANSLCAGTDLSPSPPPAPLLSFQLC